MTSGNGVRATEQSPESTSDNRSPVSGSRRRGRARTELPAPLEEIQIGYVAQLKSAPVDDDTRRAYASRVRQYLAWLGAAQVDADPLADPHARDGAVRDYRVHLQTVARRTPATINTVLAAIADFYVRSGLGVPDVARLDLPQRAPRALPARQGTRWLRAVQRCLNPRDRVLALLPFYAGLRIGETVALDVADVSLSARKGHVVVRSGKGGRYREIPLHPELREQLGIWINDERPAWPGAATNPALFLNARGGRLGVRGASHILARLAEDAGIDAEDFTSHVLRHTFGTTLVRGGHDLVLVAELMGHRRLETTRGYALPSAADRERAINSLPTDR